MRESDEIRIRGLRVACHVGVPDAERAQAQELLLHVVMCPFPDAAPLEDNIDRTIDYHAVALRVEKVARERPRKLIETLAEDVAAAVLADFPVRLVTVEIEKFILPNARSVGTRITRTA